MRATMVVALALAAPAWADSWNEPGRVEVTSASGEWTLAVDPADVLGTEVTQPKLTLQKGGAEVYARAAVNRIAPVNVLVSDDGRVVTLGEWGRFGYLHSLVIYGAKGKVVADLTLEEILTPEEIANEVKQSISSRWWLAEKDPVRFEKGSVVVKTNWGEELAFGLADGKQRRGGKPFAVPTNQQRFHGYLIGKRKFESASVKLSESHGTWGVSCDLTPTEVSCEGWGDTKLQPWTKTLKPKQFAKALRGLTPLERHLSSAAESSLPGDHRLLLFEFTEGGNPFQYKVLVAWDGPKDAKAKKAIAALRKLAGVK